MKALLYALSLIAILVAAYFSFGLLSTFEEQQKAISDVQRLSNTVSKNAETARGEADTELENYRTSQSERAIVAQNIEKLQSDESGLRRELGELDARLEEQLVTLKEAEDAVEAARVQLESMGLPGPVDVETIGETITSLEDQKKALGQELEELETTVAGAEKAVADSRENLSRLARRKTERDARFRFNAMQSMVTAVDQEWGFVVIGAGTNTGFTPRTRLIVQRDGRRIAELRPSSVEASQTIAEIDYDTMAPGVMIQPGDRVILAKTTAD